MNSKNPFSTISYNSEKWLKDALEKFISSGDFVFFAYVLHKGEDDEAGLKDHFHVYVEPNTRFNTKKFTDACVEPDPKNPLPLRCMPCNSSAFDHWFMYTKHDENYMHFKGLGERKYHYFKEDFKSSDDDYFNCKIRTIDVTTTSWYASMCESIDAGSNFDEFFAKGGVPVQQIRNFKLAYETLSYMRYRKKSVDKSDNV